MFDGFEAGGNWKLIGLLVQNGEDLTVIGIAYFRLNYY